jgi:Zn-dependent peptidase ImmA (M78 family)
VEIRATAEQLRRDLGIQDQHAPDLAHLLNRLHEVFPKFKLKVVKDTDLPNMEAKAYTNACILKVRDGIMNALRTYGDVRARFTVAHELGHLMLGHPGNQPRPRPKREFDAPLSILESEANTFASEFLMPSELIDRKFSNDRISRLFQVSIEAAARRRRELSTLTVSHRSLPE